MMMIWVMRGLGLVVLLMLVGFAIRYFREKRRHRPSKVRPSLSPAVYDPFSYKKLQHSKNPQKLTKDESALSAFTFEKNEESELPTLSEEEALALWEDQGLSMSLLLAARAAEKGILPLYSLCGAVFIDAIPKRLYHLNQKYQAVVLSDIINVPDSHNYTHVLVVYQDEDVPVLAIASEVGGPEPLFSQDDFAAVDFVPPESSWGQAMWDDDNSSHVLSLYTKNEPSEIGRSDRWADLESFEARALKTAVETLSIKTTPMMVDDGSSSKFLETSDWEDELRKDLLFCLEIHGLFMMLQLAMLEDVESEDLESISLHRFRIDIYFDLLARLARLPIDICMMMLADLHIFSQHIREHLEAHHIDYRDVIQPMYEKNAMFASLDLLSLEDRRKRQERITGNPQLLLTVENLMDTIESNADIRLEEHIRATPSFDV
ncbi:MAG: hypothetical protein EP343_24285 [Deltaproteobacteria bacterium]|nr:MAG: hypothetical protein EP343_24285 [Deltaproteobacteria bacterium]